MAWILAEDEALKNKLLNVPRTPDGRAVGVRFRLPETELADITFPLIVIEHQDISRDPEREHRSGLTQLPYVPYEDRPWWGDPNTGEAQDPTNSPYWVPEWPTPYNIDYRIVTYTRRAQDHVWLTSVLAQPDFLDARFGYLEVPQDGTKRRLDLMGGPETEVDKDQDGKNIHRGLYLVRISSELTPNVYDQLTKVSSVALHIRDTYGTTFYRDE